MQSRIELFIGPMFGGKTTRLTARAQELAEQGLKVARIKHTNDVRWDSAGFLMTHDQNQAPADLTASTMTQIVDYAFQHECQVVAIDEGQFYPDIAELSDYLANNGVTVLVAALDSNFLNHPTSRHFENVVRLIPRAEKVTKTMATCSTCGQQNASFNTKKDPSLGNNGSDLIGGADKYDATCRACYQMKRKLAVASTASTSQSPGPQNPFLNLKPPANSDSQNNLPNIETPLTPEQRERIRKNKEMALARRQLSTAPPLEIRWDSEDDKPASPKFSSDEDFEEQLYEGIRLENEANGNERNFHTE